MKEIKQEDFYTKTKTRFQEEWENVKEDYKEYKRNSKGSIIKKVPNTLSVIRIIASPFILPVVLLNPLIGALLAAGIALTDAIDGIIARTCNAKSNLGALLDTIGDKLYSTVIALTLLSFFPIEATLLLIGEGMILITNIRAQLEKKEPKSSIIGKAKTVVLCTTSVLAVTSIALPNLVGLANIGLAVAILSETAAIIDYNYHYFKKEKERKPELKMETAPSISNNVQKTKEKEHIYNSEITYQNGKPKELKKKL